MGVNDGLSAVLAEIRERAAECRRCSAPIEARFRLCVPCRCEILASGPVVTGSTHPGYTVLAERARSAAQTVAERTPDDIPRLLAMLGITGKDGPEDGKWAVYAYGRPSTTLKGGETCLSTGRLFLRRRSAPPRLPPLFVPPATLTRAHGRRST